MSRRHHSTPMALDVPEGWFDHSVETFQASDFADTGLALVVRRGSCAGTLEAFVEQDLVETRRAHADFALIGRGKRALAGIPVEVVEVRWSHPKGTFHQHLVYGSTEERRWFRIVASAREEHARLAGKLLDQVFATAKRTSEEEP